MNEKKGCGLFFPLLIDWMYKSGISIRNVTDLKYVPPIPN